MKGKLFLALGLLMALWPRSLAQEESVRAAIEKANRQYEEAFVKRDAPALAALYTEDAQVLPPEGSVIKGRKAIEAFWGKGLATTTAAKVQFKVADLEVSGDFAYEAGTFEEVDAASKVVDRGKYLVVWKRERGQWRMHRDIWNSEF